jgi:hypothetical protein
VTSVANKGRRPYRAAHWRLLLVLVYPFTAERQRLIGGMLEIEFVKRRVQQAGAPFDNPVIAITAPLEFTSHSEAMRGVAQNERLQD